MSTPIERLLGTMRALRDPDSGCPWDLQQDFRSLAPYAIEEAYEVADAAERGDFDELKQELGDLLLQVVFHSQLARERGLFDFDAVATAINDKLVRRHPQVFGESAGAGAARFDAEAQSIAWEQIKRAEREHRHGADASALDGITRGLPEWQRAHKLQKQAAAAGFDWPDVAQVFDKLQEEIDEARAEFRAGRGHAALQDEIGDILFVCVNLARHARIDFGAALRRANAKFERRFRCMERLAAEQGDTLAQMDLARMEALWQCAKNEEKTDAKI